MFMFPEPPPINCVLEEVSPTFLSDGVFLHDNLGPSHKCIAKQLRTIKRGISDPVATPNELDPHFLDASAEKERPWYAGPRNSFLIYELLSRLNEQKFVKRKHGDEISVFPRSRQYEYENIQRKRLENVPMENFVDVFQCGSKKGENDTTRADNEPCDVLKAPFWWKDKTPKKLKVPVGSINDYAFNRLEYTEDDIQKVERSMSTDRAFEPDNDEIQAPEIIHQTKHAINIMEDQKKRLKLDCSCTCSPTKDDFTRKTDTRWQPIYEMTGFSGTDAERNETLRMLTKPYLRELNMWYGKNLPTKLLLPVRWKGKRPIPEWRFSHLWF